MGSEAMAVAPQMLEVSVVESEAVRQMRDLESKSWGAKRIARELGLTRGTVRRHLRGGETAEVQRHPSQQRLDEARQSGAGALFAGSSGGTADRRRALQIPHLSFGARLLNLFRVFGHRLALLADMQVSRGGAKRGRSTRRDQAPVLAGLDTFAALVAGLGDDGRDVHHSTLDLPEGDALKQEGMSRRQKTAARVDKDDRELHCRVPAVALVDGEFEGPAEVAGLDDVVDGQKVSPHRAEVPMTLTLSRREFGNDAGCGRLTVGLEENIRVEDNTVAEQHVLAGRVLKSNPTGRHAHGRPAMDPPADGVVRRLQARAAGRAALAGADEAADVSVAERAKLALDKAPSGWPTKSCNSCSVIRSATGARFFSDAAACHNTSAGRGNRRLRARAPGHRPGRGLDRCATIALSPALDDAPSPTRLVNRPGTYSRVWSLGDGRHGAARDNILGVIDGHAHRATRIRRACRTPAVSEPGDSESPRPANQPRLLSPPAPAARNSRTPTGRAERPRRCYWPPDFRPLELESLE